MQQTHWHVITGAPCSGKTAVIRELARRGYRVVDEVARALIDTMLASGLTLEEIKADAPAFERRILQKKVSIETALPVNATVFLDRAIPDSIAYFRQAALDIEDPLVQSRRFRYKTIFIFDRLTFKKDAVRVEDDIRAGALDRLLEEGYAMLGYEVIRVPVLTIVERADLVLRRCGLIPAPQFPKG